MTRMRFFFFFVPFFVLFGKEGLLYSRKEDLPSVHILQVDPNLYDIISVRALNGKESVLSLSKRYNAVAGINGGFFKADGNPAGALKIQDWITLPQKPRGCIGWSNKNSAPKIDRIEATNIDVRDQDIFYTSIQIQSKTGLTSSRDWEACDYIVGGCPVLLLHERRMYDFEFEQITIPTFITKPHARTAIGILPNGHWVLAVVDQFSCLDGMTLLEIGDFMARIGCTDALNLDGGKSSTLVFEGEIKNYCFKQQMVSGNETTVSDAILILPKKGIGL